MSLVNLLYGRKTSMSNAATKVSLLSFDAVLSEGHTYKNVVTMFPVEDGLDITDHIRQEPERLKIDAIITAAPLDDTASTARWLSAYNLLLSLMGRQLLTSQLQKQSIGKPVLVDIISGIRVWTDMAIETIDVPRDAQTGDAMNVKIDLVNIRKASLQIANVQFLGGGIGVGDQVPAFSELGFQQAEKPGFVADPKDSYALQLTKWIQYQGWDPTEMTPEQNNKASMYYLGKVYHVNAQVQ